MTKRYILIGIIVLLLGLAVYLAARMQLLRLGEVTPITNDIAVPESQSLPPLPPAPFDTNDNLDQALEDLEVTE